MSTVLSLRDRLRARRDAERGAATPGPFRAPDIKIGMPYEHTRQCPVCRQWFALNSNRQVYCGVACANQKRRSEAREARSGKRREQCVECPTCGGETSVIDSRPVLNGVRRRRKCDDCEARFSTYEIIAGDVPSGTNPLQHIAITKKTAAALRALAKQIDAV